MFVSCTTESSYLSSCIRKYQACNCQTSNVFVKFLICFHSFFLLSFSASMDDDSLMCRRETYVRELLYCICSSTRRIPSISFFGIKNFRYLGPILHACALFITSCNITFRSAHHVCSVTTPTIAMWSWGIDPFSEYTPYSNFCTTLKDSNKKQLLTPDQAQARAERMHGTLLRVWSTSINVLVKPLTLTSLFLLWEVTLDRYFAIFIYCTDFSLQIRY